MMEQFFRNWLTHLLCDDEAVEVDSGYRGDVKMKEPLMACATKMCKEKSQVQGRHENVNGRMKQFDVLTTHF